MTRTLFGTMPDGTPVELVTLTNRNGMEVRVIGKGGTVYGRRSPHHANFPSTILRPGQAFESMTVVKFGVQQESDGPADARSTSGR